jgi:hypothetical protein
MADKFEMKLTQKLAKEYKEGNKKEKGKILDRYCKLTGAKRNTAAKRFRRKMRNPYPRALKVYTGRKRGPKKKYTIVHRKIIRHCWELSGQICGERLRPMLEIYLDQLGKNSQLNFYQARDIAQVKKIPLGTLKKIMADFPSTNKGKRKGNAEIYKEVPIVANFGKFAHQKPGCVEIDFVEHNGGNSQGKFAITGQFVDVYSQWIARSASLGKSQKSIEKIDKLAQQKIYHPIYHYHPDNNKSILNILHQKTRDDKQKKLSRSRPYKKNDNAHVEQKNGDKVRKLVGYFRYDTKEESRLLNRIYNRADLLDNFFIPSAKLKSKVRDKKGRVIKRCHDEPKTPYQRLISYKKISRKTKKNLTKIYTGLNMVILRREVDLLIDELLYFQRQKNGRENV